MDEAKILELAMLAGLDVRDHGKSKLLSFARLVAEAERDRLEQINRAMQSPLGGAQRIGGQAAAFGGYDPTNPVVSSVLNGLLP